MGTSSADTALPNGCFLHVEPLAAIIGLATQGGAYGWTSHATRLPDDVALLAPHVTVQALTLDPSVFLGYSLTNAVEIEFAAP